MVITVLEEVMAVIFSSEDGELASHRQMQRRQILLLRCYNWCGCQQQD